MDIHDYLPGKRILKTALAVGICLTISSIFKFSAGFYMVVATVLTMKTTSEQSIAFGKSRVEGTFVGGIIGLLVISLFQLFHIQVSSIGYILLNMIGTIACILVAKVLKRPDASASSACVMLFTITINRAAMNVVPVPYVFARVIETLVGIIVAVLVNVYIGKDTKNIEQEK